MQSQVAGALRRAPTIRWREPSRASWRRPSAEGHPLTEPARPNGSGRARASRPAAPGSRLIVACRIRPASTPASVFQRPEATSLQIATTRSGPSSGPVVRRRESRAAPSHGSEWSGGAHALSSGNVGSPRRAPMPSFDRTLDICRATVLVDVWRARAMSAFVALALAQRATSSSASLSAFTRPREKLTRITCPFPSSGRMHRSPGCPGSRVFAQTEKTRGTARKCSRRSRSRSPKSLV